MDVPVGLGLFLNVLALHITLIPHPLVFSRLLLLEFFEQQFGGDDPWRRHFEEQTQQLACAFPSVSVDVQAKN